MFDSLAPVIALLHAVWDGWMPLATMAKCVRKAQLEQRENARPGRRQRPFWSSHWNSCAHAVDDPRA